MAKKAKTSKTIVVRPDEAERQAEAAKTTRLRALRLAKEAADRDAVSPRPPRTPGSTGVVGRRRPP